MRSFAFIYRDDQLCSSLLHKYHGFSVACSPSIGIILCKSKSKLIAEYALRDTHDPIGVSTYRITEVLPNQLKASLPSSQTLKAELERRLPRQ